jgi:cytochrome P450
VLSQLRTQGSVDNNMLGNLIYAVEMGRYDLAAFLRWLLWFAAGAPDWMDRIAAEDRDGDRAPAFVSEAFRLEQSERLVRRVERDFVAEGYLFPKGAKVRLCIWESHKSPMAHAQPFVFDPGRFIRERPGPDRFAPFGLDRHQCPFGAYATRFGAAFLKAVADRFVVIGASSASAVRGLYHWEPPADFRPVFLARPRGPAR